MAVDTGESAEKAGNQWLQAKNPAKQRKFNGLLLDGISCKN
jgi:hypothetical protein